MLSSANRDEVANSREAARDLTGPPRPGAGLSFAVRAFARPVTAGGGADTAAAGATAAWSQAVSGAAKSSKAELIGSAR